MAAVAEDIRCLDPDPPLGSTEDEVIVTRREEE
jgi:hypothetical protein